MNKNTVPIGALYRGERCYAKGVNMVKLTQCLTGSLVMVLHIDERVVRGMHNCEPIDTNGYCEWTDDYTKHDPVELCQNCRKDVLDKVQNYQPCNINVHCKCGRIIAKLNDGTPVTKY